MSRPDGTDEPNVEQHPVASPDMIERARTGDREAIAALWRLYQPQLLRLLRARRCSASEDVASQVWIEVARSLIRFEGDGIDFRRWLFTIAHRRSIDEARRQSLRQRREQPVELVDPAGDDATSDRTDELCAVERAVALVAQLPPNMAEALMLRVVHDLAVDEVATIMDTSEGNVRVLVHRGLRRLRDAIDASELSDRPAKELRIKL